MTLPTPRRFSTQAPATPSAPALDTPATPTGRSAAEIANEHAALTARATRLTQGRMRREAQFETTERELQAILREASALGVSTLAQFEALIAEQLARDAEEDARYARELDIEEALQAEVDARMRAVDGDA